MSRHDQQVDFIWNIANKLRGPYRPPQYRRVMLPMIVLRRLDCVVAEKKEMILHKYAEFQAQGHSEEAIHTMLSNLEPLYNTSLYDFSKLLDDADNIARNLVAYIQGFSKNVRDIFEYFDFEQEIEKLDNANRLFLILQEFANTDSIDLHPDRIDNLQMGDIFEELVRKFNEQANEEAGDHFTPREVITLMAHLIYTGEEDIYTSGISRSIYDPTCGTGGMLSVSEKYIREHNKGAHLHLFGQEYNPESYAICCADLLIKNEPVGNVKFGDTLGDGKTADGHPGEKFHYMLANPPFGVEWKTQQAVVEGEHKELGFAGRFGAGTPRINDGALLFLLHMMSKMKSAPKNGGDGSKIAIVFNGSPLFTGDAGSGESNIRRWIIEGDLLDAVIALPDQMFYNTGIYTYIWIVSNKKKEERKGKIQLIDATHHYKKMRKSLGNKRHELGMIHDEDTISNILNNTQDHVREITKLYAEFTHDQTSNLTIDGKERICSKIFENREFGFLKMTVERPLRLNFQASPERIERLWQEKAFINLAESKKRKDEYLIREEQEKGSQYQKEILRMLGEMDDQLYKNRDAFIKVLNKTVKQDYILLAPPVQKAILNALSERDETADICMKGKKPEPDPDLRDTELVPLPEDVNLPLPIGYGDKADNIELVRLMYDHCEAYFEREVKPHIPDAWIDHSKLKVGYEIPLNRHFYVYEPPRPLEEIEQDIKQLEQEIVTMLGGIVA